MAQVQGMNLLLSAGATAAGYVAVSPRFAGGVMAGAVVESVNLRAMWRFSERAIFDQGGGSAIAAGAFGVRFVVMGAVIFALLSAGMHPVGLLVGLSMVIPSVVTAAWLSRPAPSDAAPLAPTDDAAFDDWNPWLAREVDRDDEDEEEQSLLFPARDDES